MVDPTFIDRIYYVHRNYGKSLPKVWFRVPMEDVTQLILPIHHGGYVHISFLEIPYYVQTLIEREERELRTAVLKNFDATEYSQFFDPLVEEIFTWQKSQIIKQSSSNTKFQGTGNFDPLDLEDLVATLPPCARPLADLERGEFPRDEERQHLVRIMRKGRIPIEAIGKLLKLLNEKYPHQPMAMDTIQRWNYIAHYNKDYAAARCEKLPKCMHCPFAGSVDQRKMQCHAKFIDAFPDDVAASDAQYFFGPASWLYWRMRRK